MAQIKEMALESLKERASLTLHHMLETKSWMIKILKLWKTCNLSQSSQKQKITCSWKAGQDSSRVFSQPLYKMASEFYQGKHRMQS